MITFSVKDLLKNFVRFQMTIGREPMAVTSNGRVIGYFISPDEFEEYVRLRARLPRAYSVDELSEETVQAISASKMDARHDHLNRLLDGS